MSNTRRAGTILLWTFVALGVGALAVAKFAPGLFSSSTQPAASAANDSPTLRLAVGSQDTLELEPRLVNTLGVRTAQVQPARSHDHLNLSGSLFLDSNRMVRVHSRFPGEVVSIGNCCPNSKDPTESRPLRLGDRVTKGQLLAVIWSKEVGEKKSDLVNALSKLYLDEAQLKSLRALGKDVVAGGKLREAEREREADIIEVDRVERTLRSWRLTEAEINVVRDEAEKIHRGDIVADMAVDKSWAEVEVRCPFDGIVLEKNVVAGDFVESTSLDLFKIADLNILGVMANVYEDDLPALDSLPLDQRKWMIQLKSQTSAPGIPGSFDLIGNIVDPNQHTAAVMGWLDNRDGKLRAGQFITAVVDLPATAGEVVVPDTALVEDGDRAVVFVASDEHALRVTRRRVVLVGRGQDVAYIRSEPTRAENSKGCGMLKPGEWVVVSGSIELDGALDNELATTPQAVATNPQRDSLQN